MAQKQACISFRVSGHFIFFKISTLEKSKEDETIGSFALVYQIDPFLTHKEALAVVYQMDTSLTHKKALAIVYQIEKEHLMSSLLIPRRHKVKIIDVYLEI